MLDYLYTADYDNSESMPERLDESAARQLSPSDITSQTAKTCQMRIHVRVWAAGDRYDIAGLRALAEDKFENCLKEGEWDSPEFSDVVAEVYDCTATSSRLRIIAVEYSARNIHQLMDKGEFNDLIKDASSFGGDLLVRRTCNNSRTSKGEAFVGYCNDCRYAVKSSELMEDSLKDPVPMHLCKNCGSYYAPECRPVILWD